MTLSIAHAKVSAIADDPTAAAAGEVVPSDWNAAHAISGGTSGSVLFIDAGGNLAQDNANLFWDATNHLLKINAAQVASTNALLVSGTQYRGGTAAATMPFVLFKVNGGYGSPVSWNTSGTIWGADVDGSFSGNLMDFRFAGVQLAYVDYQGHAVFNSFDSLHDVNAARYVTIGYSGNGYTIPNSGIYFYNGGNTGYFSLRLDDGPTQGALAFFDGTGSGAASLRVYNAWSSSGTNYERGIFDWLTTANVLTIGTQKGGTGVARNVQLIAGGSPFLLYQSALANLFLGSGTVAGGATGTTNIIMGGNGSPFLTSGSYNLGIGYQTMLQLTSGQYNVAIGSQAMNSTSSGDYSVGIGAQALQNANQSYCVGVGYQSLYSGPGAFCIGVGAYAGKAATGSYGTFVGYNGGSNITSGDNNTFLGGWPGPSGALSGVIALSTGWNGGSGTLLQLDFNYTNSGKWTFAAPIVPPAYTVATLPAGVAGATAYVTDGTGALAWGATVTGGASTKYLVWYNGSNWTVAGK